MSVSLTTPDCKRQRGGSESQEFANETVFDRNHQESGKTYLQTLRHRECAGERESAGVLSGSFFVFSNLFQRVVAICPSEFGISEGRQRLCVALVKKESHTRFEFLILSFSRR